jgi:hypothetical protein
MSRSAMLKYCSLPFIRLIVLILAGVAALIAAQPTAAGVDLNANYGEALWFFRACQPEPLGDTATWRVDLNPVAPNRRSLRVQVENAYPGYQLVCELHFANTGQFSIAVEDIQVLNPHPGDLVLAATVAPGEQGQVLRPCGGRPHWGQDPASLPANCQSRINLALTIGPEVGEGQRLNFAVQVRLEEMPGGCQLHGIDKPS